eukprot:CAMPEP_0197895194 /NCGR_PEP_ID=MMETSP1439-20131203/36771_1 /TAXON_ID=66791 /ORGANISM="Gonyaulax spinifera, Strain CCMP409" /LENGTH=47 /DNA_ID= /DNA_START= /DNA_END= /DNA_ORIENTATION=
MPPRTVVESPTNHACALPPALKWTAMSNAGAALCMRRRVLALIATKD